MKDKTTIQKEAESKPIYVVQNKKDIANKVILHQGAEPVALSFGFLKLAGTITGDHPMALLEIDGKGSSFQLNDRINDYQIVSINEREVQLCLKK